MLRVVVVALDNGGTLLRGVGWEIASLVLVELLA
jgi:hypothetical protein